MLVTGAAVSLLLCGCGRQEPQSEEPLVVDIHLVKGQTPDEVIALAGEPNGRVEIGDDLYFLYNSGKVTFRDGLLVDFARHEELEGGNPVERRADSGNAEKKGWSFFGTLDETYKTQQVPGQITVVAFYAGWAPPGRQGIPELADWVNQRPGVAIRKVSVASQEDPMLAKYGLTQLPCFKVLDEDGQVVGRPCYDRDDVIERVQYAEHGFFENIKASFLGYKDEVHASLLAPGSVTVVYFYASWCGSCTRYTPMIRELVRKHPGVVLRMVDIGDRGQMSVVTKYEVYDGVPSVRVFDADGRKVGGTVRQPMDVEANIQKALKRSD